MTPCRRRRRTSRHFANPPLKELDCNLVDQHSVNRCAYIQILFVFPQMYGNTSKFVFAPFAPMVFQPKIVEFLACV